MKKDTKITFEWNENEKKVWIKPENGTGVEYEAGSVEEVAKAVMRYFDTYTDKEEDEKEEEDDTVEVTVYAHPYMDQRGTLQAPKSLVNDPAAMTEYVNSRFWEISFKENDLDYGGSTYDIYVGEEELVCGAPVPDDDEDWDEDEDDDEDWDEDEDDDEDWDEDEDEE